MPEWPTARADPTRSASGAVISTSPATAGTATSRPWSRARSASWRPIASRDAASAFDPEVAPPWEKAAWRNPGTRHTGTAGAGSSRIAAAARVWAEAYALGAW